MAKRAVYEELDLEIDRLMKEDVATGEEGLLAVAADLKQMPTAEFRARLKSDLEDHAMFVAAGRKYQRPLATGRVLEMPKPLFSTVAAGNFALSVGLHVVMLALVVSSGAWFVSKEKVKVMVNSSMITDATLVLPPSLQHAGGGGGGGDQDKLAAPQGRLPKQSMQQITPPAIVIRSVNPKLEVEPTVVAPPINMAATLPELGNPMSRVAGPPSNGPGSNGGTGSGSSGGVGSGIGAGVGPGYGGGYGNGAYRVGGGVSAPRILYAPDPDYSEEARKAKFQGTVTLWLIVGPDGHPRDTRVARSLGMGLDEKAIAAVNRWKFEPALKDGRPVPVQINVEVNFRMF